MSRRETYIDRVAIALFVILGLFAAMMVYLRNVPLQPSHTVTAHVIRILPIGARVPRIAVVAETSTGISGQTTVALDDFRCSVGDDIDAVQTGVTLVPKPSSCRKQITRRLARRQTSSTSLP